MQFPDFVCVVITHKAPPILLDIRAWRNVVVVRERVVADCAYSVLSGDAEKKELTTQYLRIVLPFWITDNAIDSDA